jgi:lysozyme family protein
MSHFPKTFTEEEDIDSVLLALVQLDAALKQEYTNLYKTAQIDKKYSAVINYRVQTIQKAKARYQAVEKETKVPWWFIAIVHSLECSNSFSGHLHNGDSLQGRTIRVPKGRIPQKNPPYTWEESAIDALKLTGQANKKDYSLPSTLFFLEGYNGYGYRQYHPEVKSPYLWSFTSHYKKGKYVADGKFDKEAVSKQIGAVCLLKAMKIF